MATLATIYNRFLVGNARQRAEQTTMRERECARPHASYGLRPLPFEDVYIFTKQIDNTRVVQQEDPKSRRTCLRFLVASTAVVVIFTSMLRFGALTLIEGYQIQALKQEQQRLLNERAVLELEEAKLLSPQRLEELAKLQQFIDPEPNSVVYLDSKDQAMAMNNAGSH